MPKAPKFPLDPDGREFRPYKGDWERLAILLAPTKVKPSEFIREMVNHFVTKMQARIDANIAPYVGPEDYELPEENL